MSSLGEALREVAAARAARGPDHLSPERRTEYQRYLLSAEWAARRAAVLERVTDEDGDARCERCGWIDVLQVHHLTYANFGHEPLSDLQALCPRCHPLADAERRRRRRRWW